MACHTECAHASRMISAAFVQELTWHISSGHVRDPTQKSLWVYYVFAISNRKSEQR